MESAIPVDPHATGVQHAPAAGYLTVVAENVHREGGMERAQYEVLAGLLARGWRVNLLSRTCELPAHERLTWTRIRTLRRPFALAYPAFVVVASVVLARKRRGPVATLGALVVNRVDVTTVQFCHHGFAANAQQRGQRLSLARSINDGLGAATARVMERWCFRAGRVAHFTAVSSLVAQEVTEHFATAAAVTVIPNGTDPAHFRPDPDRRRQVRAELNIDDDELVALFVGGDWQRKGLAVALEAAAKSGWRLLVVGAGDRRSQADTIRATGARVDFLGVCSDPASIFSSADAFVLPSSYEGFALVTVEAAASGLPLLVTDATGAGDIAEAGGGRLLPREADAFAEALRELGADPASRLRMGHRARDAASALAWPNIVDRYERVYAGIAVS